MRRALALPETDVWRWWGAFAAGDGTKLDLAHMTPSVLRTYFPQEFEKADQTERYAIMRNPEDRLLSSFNEHLVSFRNSYGLAGLKPKALLEMAAEVQARLSNVTDPYPLDLVHFTPQSSYLEDFGAPYIPNIFRIDQLDELLADIEVRCGIETAAVAIHRGRRPELKVAGPGFARAVGRANAFVRAHLPHPVYNVAKSIGEFALASPRNDETYAWFKDSDVFQHLLTTIYERDVALWREYAEAAPKQKFSSFRGEATNEGLQ